MSNEKKLNLILIGTGLSLFMQGFNAIREFIVVCKAKKVMDNMKFGGMNIQFK